MSENVEQLVQFELDKKQQMMAFAFLADITAGVVYELDKGQKLESLQQEVQKNLHDQINAVFSNTKVAPALGAWKCEGYPWVDLEQDSRGLILARNTTAIFTNGNDVVVAVAGTNFIENYDWFTEDLSVQSQVAWSDVSAGLSDGSPTRQVSSGVISKGTQISLQNTWDQKGSVSGKNLAKTIKEVVSGMTDVRLSVTGHSLGGAICPVTAQALFEHVELWRPASATPSVSAYPFAGPTVGNQAFADYVQPKKMVEGKIDLVSTYNDKDVVPHGWNLKMMGEMHSLFSPFLNDADTAEYGELIKATIGWLTTKSKQADAADNYVRWNSESTFTGTFPTDHKEFNRGAIAFSGVLLGALALKDNKTTKDAICKICGLESIEDTKLAIALITPYMIYFSKFLMLLGREHIVEYYAGIIGNETFITDYQAAIKAAKGKVSKTGALRAGMDVLMELFVDVAAA